MRKHFFFFQCGPYRTQHGDKACRAAHKVGNRFRPEDAVHAHLEQARQQDGQRDDDNHLAEDREKDRMFCLAQRHKRGLPGKLEGHHEEPKEIHVQRWNARL